MLTTILLMIEDRCNISFANNACYVHISFLICDENACKTNSVIYFKLFQQKCDLYFTVRDINPAQRASHILLYVGDEGLRMLNSWSLSAADAVNPDLKWDKFTAHIEPQVNFRVQRYYLQKYIQSEEETIDTFFTHCKLQALRCKFTQAELNERLIGQLIVGTIFPGLQKELLGKTST